MAYEENGGEQGSLKGYGIILANLILDFQNLECHSYFSPSIPFLSLAFQSLTCFLFCFVFRVHLPLSCFYRPDSLDRAE